MGLVLILGSMIGCKEMDGKYKDFVVPGGLEYVGKPNQVKVYPGKNRLMLKWLKGSDPKIAVTRVYWNNYADSLELSIDPAKDTVEVLIEDLEEKNYSFFLRSFDNEGNASVPLEVMARVYGSKYANNLLNRGLNRLEMDVSGRVSLNWGLANLTSGAVATQVSYTSTSGAAKTKLFPATEESSVIEDFKAGEPLRFRTVYIPDTLAIDTFYTEYDQGSHFYFDKKDWSIADFSSEHPGGDNTVRNVIDGTAGTRWHSLAGGSSYPHHVTIDMGVEHLLTQVGVWRTTFENGGDTRAPDRIHLYASTDNSNWLDLGEHAFDRFLNGEQLYPITGEVRARYFKLVGTQGPENNFVLGEISMYGF